MEHETKIKRRQRTVQRIHRLQGQLTALERVVAEDGTSCQDIVIQARAIEKAMTSLITHVVGGYLEHDIKNVIQENPDAAIREIQRIFQLFND